MLCLVRQWLSIAVRRRSCKLMSKAFKLADQTNISMDQIFEAGVFGGPVSTPCMSFFAPLLYKSPILVEELVGPRLAVTELHAGLLADLGVTAAALDAGWAFARYEDRGLLQIFVSAGLERDVVSYADMEEGYVANTKTLLSWLFTPKEQIKNMHAAGLHLRALTHQGMTAPALAVRTTLTCRDGIKEVRGSGSMCMP